MNAQNKTLYVRSGSLQGRKLPIPLTASLTKENRFYVGHHATVLTYSQAVINKFTILI
jgi:hypothetical protein